MNHSYTFDDIARYASGDMTGEELTAFIASLATDADLQQQLALYQEVQQQLVKHFSPDERQEQLQQTLQSLRTEYFTGTQKKARVVPFKRYLRPAIGVAAAVIIALFVWQPWQTDLYTTYARTQMVAVVERGDNADTLLQQATMAFNKENFKQAASLLDKTTQLQPDNSFALFYYGVSLTHLKESGKARIILNGLYNGSSAFKYDAAFYLALTYIQEEDKVAARQWLQRIPSDTGVYTKASKLLEEL